MKMIQPCLWILLILCFSVANAACRYNINENMLPQPVDYPPFELGPLTACKDFVSPHRLGCCSKYNDAITLKNFKQIDGIFGSQGSGCDICAINLKRFWCEYACSDRQDQFMEAAQQYQPFPDPQHPGNIIYGQRVKVRVHTQTACKIYQSCKRNTFVASVSAMGSPAGFLNFQGHNAINDGHQYISMEFSYNLNDSLAFSNKLKDFPYDDLMSCNYVTSEPMIHNFTFKQNCSCSTCEQACNASEGFQYSQPEVFEGFDGFFVGGVYIFVIALAGGVTFYRKRKQRMRNND